MTEQIIFILIPNWNLNFGCEILLYAFCRQTGVIGETIKKSRILALNMVSGLNKHQQ